MDIARDRPVAAAAVGIGAAAAGLFLWSKRSQISNQLNLSDQIGEWTENMGSGSSFGDMGSDTAGLTTSGGSGASSSCRSSGSRGMSETGGGNASLWRIQRRGRISYDEPERPRSCSLHPDGAAVISLSKVKGAPSGAPFLCAEEASD